MESRGISKAQKRVNPVIILTGVIDSFQGDSCGARKSTQLMPFGIWQGKSVVLGCFAVAIK